MKQMHFHPESWKLENESEQTIPVEILVETPRLLIRRMIRADFPWLFQLHHDAEVMRFIRPPDQTPAETEAKMESILQDPRWADGYGTYPVHLKSSGEVVGWTLLNYFPESGIPETGYRLFTDHWGQGIATEITMHFVSYLHQVLNLPLIGACTHPDNMASKRVLTKCGFKANGSLHVYGVNASYFEHSL